MVVLVPSALYQNPETKWLFCSPIKDAFHTKELFPNSHPPKKSIGHRNPHEGSIPDNNLIDKSVLRNHEPQAAFRKLELCFRMWWSLPIGSWPTRTPHKMFSVSWNWTIENWTATFEPGKTGCKGLKSREDKARAVQQKVARSKRCPRHNWKEHQVMHRVHRWGSVDQG